MSVDSYIAGPNGEMDWMVWSWDDKLKNYVFELTEPVDTIILGIKYFIFAEIKYFIIGLTGCLIHTSLLLWRCYIWYVNSKKSLVEWIIVHRNRN